jgi:hypothetical protein
MTCRCGLLIYNVLPHLRDCCPWECRACAERAIHVNTRCGTKGNITRGLLAPREARLSLREETDNKNNFGTVTRAKIEQLRRLVGGKT